MGRIKTQLVKRLTEDLIKEHHNRLSTSFEDNKEAVAELIEGASKKIRNTVAGYATRLMKTREDL
ncbi:30S ribosomal protein S17e [Candidatus Woesearchaeota archaeon]|nr:MAG: 30S ribosomal protein S17e [Candidatus Woesearchaeota archaeon]